MKYVRLLFIAPLLAALVACDDDGITVNQVPPAALVRVVNAAVETGTIDLRFVDQVENLPVFLQIPFRGHSGAGYHRVIPGTRHLRVFPTSTDPEVSQQRLVDDAAFNLTADQRVTLVVTREAEGHQVTRIEEAHPTPGSIPRAPADQISVKALHAATGEGNVNVYVVATPIPADWRTNNAHVFRSVGYLEVTESVNVPVLSGSNLYAFIATSPVAAGSDGDAAIRFFGIPDQPGTTSGSPETVGPQPGVRIQESVLTAVLTSGDVNLLIDRALDPPWPSQQ